jgi:hypothetical protein
VPSGLLLTAMGRGKIVLLKQLHHAKVLLEDEVHILGEEKKEEDENYLLQWLLLVVTVFSPFVSVLHQINLFWAR